MERCLLVGGAKKREGFDPPFGPSFGPSGNGVIVIAGPRCTIERGRVKGLFLARERGHGMRGEGGYRLREGCKVCGGGTQKKWGSKIGQKKDPQKFPRPPKDIGHEPSEA